jgi:vancomycin resistance protein VanW
MRGIFKSRMKTAAAVLTRMKPLSLYHPALYWLRVWQKRLGGRGN